MLLERRAVCGRPSCLPRAERIRSVGGKNAAGGAAPEGAPRPIRALRKPRGLRKEESFKKWLLRENP